MDLPQLLTAETMVTVVMAAFAFIGLGNTVFTLVRNVKDAKKPHDERLEILKQHEEKLERDYKIIQDLQVSNQLLIENDLAVIEHVINGNHIDRLKVRRDRMQQYLIEKS